MKQIAQYQDGRLEFQEAPEPIAPPGGILVRTTHSVISLGTEKMKVEQAKMNLLQKARARPDQVRKVLDTAKTLGWKSALEKVKNRLESPTPLGYSAAGVVVAVDPLNTRFQVGDRVAIGGAECAFHAEKLAIPDMLAEKVPDATPSWMAAYTTIASIALQAVRQTEPRLGDRVLVVGQGLVGLLVTNLLSLSGARVLATDLQESRRDVSLAMGASQFINPGRQEMLGAISQWTGGYGADAAIVCVGGSSAAPIEQAGLALRDRGRLVDVGILKIELPWKLFYEKELEVRFSRSYGPGRYDPTYEWGGADYPIGYVRWTERRNFQALLDLMSTQQLELDAITTKRLPFAQALDVYRAMTDGSASDEIGVVLEYEAAPAATAPTIPEAASARPSAAKPQRLKRPVPTVDVIGAGNFARTMLLPSLKGAINLGTVANQTALSAKHVQTKFGFAEASADAHAVIRGSQEAAVLIATRHHLHAPLVLESLRSGRQVFVEKPLCLNPSESLQIASALQQDPQLNVHVGFNRRFAPLSVALRNALAAVTGPKIVNFRVMAGALDPHLRTLVRTLVPKATDLVSQFHHVIFALPVGVTKTGL